MKTIAFFSTLALTLGFTVAMSPNAIAADWRETGVTTRTRETVAIDVDSITRTSRYGVKFRYLIGKDLINATVNCASSKVTPDRGAAFVPDLNGATRNMINIACGNRATNSPTVLYAERTVSNVNSFHVSMDAINAVRRLSDYSFGKEMFATPIARDLRNVCLIFQDGGTRTRVWAQQNVAIIENPQLDRDEMLDYFASLNVVATSRVCPEYQSRWDD